MNEQKEKYIGMAMIIPFFIIGAIYGGLEFFIILIALSFYGWFGTKLYEMESKTWLGFLLIKIPLNVFFNLGLMFLLLLKSWTMLSFKDELNNLDFERNK
jgi:hypothetical protein